MQQGCGGALQGRGRCAGTVDREDPGAGVVAVVRRQPARIPRPRAAGADLAATARRPRSPLTNRAISETYPPGSTFKVITTAAALQNGATEDGAADRGRLDSVAGQHRHAWRTTAAHRAATPKPFRCARRSRSRVTPRSSNSACSPVPKRCAAWRSRSAWTPSRSHPAAGRRIDRRTDSGCRGAGNVEHRAEGRRDDAAGECRRLPRPSRMPG